MPKTYYFLLALLVQVVVVHSAFASDFDWLKQLSIQAQADPSGFVAKLSARFKIGDAKVRTVISNVGSQADAYMVLRLAEMSHQPVKEVTRVYRRDRRRGWGVIARKLGIRPGSRAFHALKAGDELGMGRRTNDEMHHGHSHFNNHGHGHGNDGHGRGHGRNGN